MTIQARELILFKGESYILFGDPFNEYLKLHPDINPKYSTAHFRGYQGNWELTNDRLYLNNLLCDNYNFQSLFNTEKPVIAEWFTGIISIGIGDPITDDDWNVLFDHYLWIKIERGIITLKKIQKRIFHEENINFGKYKGCSIDSLLNGKINSPHFKEILQKEYFLEILKYLTEYNFKKNIHTPFFEITDEIRITINNCRSNTINYLITKDFLAIESNFDDDLDSKLSEIFEKVISSNFDTIIKLYKNVDDKTISVETMLVNDDIDYVKWAVKNVDDFIVAPHLIKTEEFRRLIKYEVNRIKPNLITFNPIYNIVKRNFPQELYVKIKEDFEKKHDVLFDEINRIYVPNLSEDILKSRFEYYLNDHSMSPEDKIEFYNSACEFSYDENYNEMYFDTMTDGQLGTYSDYMENNNLDDISDWSGN